MNGPCPACGQQCDSQFPRACPVLGGTCMPERHGWFEGELADAAERLGIEPGFAEPEVAFRARLDEAWDALVLRRWETFTDRELREVQRALAESPTAGSMRAHDMIAEITVEAARRGDKRALMIVGEPGADDG